jgi:4-amino-4-deoxy-L-arabinose transferase-like glycosyltransferase
LTKRDRLWETDHRLLLGGVLVLLLLLSFYLRVAGLAEKSLWQDEIFTAAISSPQNSLSQVASIPLYNTALPAPPLYFLITHFFLMLGDNDFILRFPALLSGVLGVAGMYALGTRLFDRETGLVGSILLSVSSLHVRYSQDARFYGLMVLLSLMTLYCLWRALMGGKKVWWLGFVICTLLNIYNHLFGLLVLLAEAVFVVGLWIGRGLRACRTDSSEGRHSLWMNERFGIPPKDDILGFLASLTLVLVLYLPMVPHLLRGATSSKGLGGEISIDIGATLTFLGQALDAWANGPGLVSLLFLLPFVLGLAACVPTRHSQLWLACCWLALPMAVLLFVPARHGFRPRYVLFILPVFLILVAYGLVASSRALGKRVSGPTLETQPCFLGLSVLVLALVSITTLWGYYDEPRSDWKAVAKMLGSSYSGNEIVVSPGPFAQLALKRYEEDLSEAAFSIGGSEVFLSSERAAEAGVWFVGPGREAMASTEAELRAAMPWLFKVVFEVDDDRAERGIRLSIAPTMYSDLWVLYARDGLGLEDLIERYEEALEAVPPAVGSSIRATLNQLYQERRKLDQAAVDCHCH